MRRITFKNALALSILSLGMLAFNSCIFDAEQGTPPDGGTPPPAFKSLKNREDVLFNLKLAYNERNINQYNKLLDNNFTFFFSAVDVREGKVRDLSWPRSSELIAVGHMFDPTFDPAPHTNPDGSITDPGPILRITVDMSFAAGENTWNPVIDEVVHPGEIWYEKTVDYRLVVKAGGNYIFQNSSPIQASFEIRFTEAEGDSVYRIVAWRDDV